MRGKSRQQPVPKAPCISLSVRSDVVHAQPIREGQVVILRALRATKQSRTHEDDQNIKPYQSVITLSSTSNAREGPLRQNRIVLV